MDAVSDRSIDAGVTFVFGGRQTFYERPRDVWGVPVVFRVLSTEDAMAADLAADRIASPAASSLERGVQCLARSIVSIDGQEYAGARDPGDDSPDGLAVLQERLAHLHDLPALLVNEAYGKFGEVASEYASLLNGDRLGESSGAVESIGAS